MKRGDKSKSDMRAIRHFPTIHEDLVSVAKAYHDVAAEFNRVVQAVRSLSLRNVDASLKAIATQINKCYKLLKEAQEFTEGINDLKSVLRSFLGDSLWRPDEEACAYVETLSTIAKSKDCKERITKLVNFAEAISEEYDASEERINALRERCQNAQGCLDEGVNNESDIARHKIAELESKREEKKSRIDDAIAKALRECEKLREFVDMQTTALSCLKKDR